MKESKNVLISIGSVAVLIFAAIISGQLGRSCGHKALEIIASSSHANEQAQAKANLDEFMEKVVQSVHDEFGPFPKKLDDENSVLGCYYLPERDTLQYHYVIHIKKEQISEESIESMKTAQREYLLKEVAPEMKNTIFDLGASVEWVYFAEDSDYAIFLVHISPSEV